MSADGLILTRQGPFMLNIYVLVLVRAFFDGCLAELSTGLDRRIQPTTSLTVTGLRERIVPRRFHRAPGEVEHRSKWCRKKKTTTRSHPTLGRGEKADFLRNF